VHLSDGSSFHPVQVVAPATLPNYTDEVLKLTSGQRRVCAFHRTDDFTCSILYRDLELELQERLVLHD
jgi:hypothetical protein